MDHKIISRSSDLSQPLELLNDNEQLKAESRFLRGNIAQGLEDQLTGAVPGKDPLLMKFHGVYQQDDRDERSQRARRKLEPQYQFMVRLRIPGGRLSAKQWLQLDAVANRYAERGLRITTRQTIQFHGVRKRDLRAFMQAIRDAGLDTIAACGDDNRGVVCGASPTQAAIEQQVGEIAKNTSDRLLPQTSAYPEIWYQEAAEARDREEPIYGPLYLPRKFKVGFAIPPSNDIDVYGQDLGLIAVVQNDVLKGFNVCVGGGMGQLDSRDDSYPRLAEAVGYVPAGEAAELAETVLGIQRDFGDRQDRHRARFKYTLDRLGTEWFLQELGARRSRPLEPARAFEFDSNGDSIGWQEASDGLWRVTLHLANGRVQGPLQEQLRAFLESFGGNIRLTTNQNLQLTHVGRYELAQAQWRLQDLGLSPYITPEVQAAHTITCVSLPTCGLAMAEAERYLPEFLPRFNAIKAQHGISEVPIVLRISGCPNGCARPYLAEIALTGRAPGLYNLYLGGSFHGDRLAQLYASNANEEKILELLSELFARYSAQRRNAEYFGDFLVRSQLLSQATL